MYYENYTSDYDPVDTATVPSQDKLVPSYHDSEWLQETRREGMSRRQLYKNNSDFLQNEQRQRSDKPSHFIHKC